MSQITEMAFPLEDLLDRITTAFADAAANLREDFSEGGEFADSPFIYHMPRMTCEIRLSFSFTKEGVKGMFSRSTNKEEQELVSTITIDIVASPKTIASGSGSSPEA